MIDKSKAEPHREAFNLLQWTMAATGVYWRLLYGSGIWMDKSQAELAVESGRKMMVCWLM